MKHMEGLALLPLVIVAVGAATFIGDEETLAEQCIREDGDCIGTYLLADDETVYRVAQETDLDSFYISVDYVREYEGTFTRAAFPDEIEEQRELRILWCAQTPTPPTCE